MRESLFVMCGGMCGVLLRYFTNNFIAKITEHDFPWATLIVNIVGSFLIGIVYASSSEHKLISETTRQLLAVGFLGGLTTFSSFSLENYKFFVSGQWGMFLGYSVCSPLLGVVFVMFGVLSMRYIMTL